MEVPFLCKQVRLFYWSFLYIIMTDCWPLWGMFVDVVHRVFSSVIFFFRLWGPQGVWCFFLLLWWSLMSSLVGWSQFCLPRGACLFFLSTTLHWLSFNLETWMMIFFLWWSQFWLLFLFSCENLWWVSFLFIFWALLSFMIFYLFNLHLQWV